MPEKVQWVNLPDVDSSDSNKSVFVEEGVGSADAMGRKIFIQADFDKKEKATVAYVKIIEDGGNAKYKSGKEAALRQDYLVPADISEEGKAQWKISLSAAGGDKFKMKVVHKGESKELPDEYLTKRRIYYQVIDMTTITGLSDLGFMDSEYNKENREIHFVQIDSTGTLDHTYDFASNSSEYRRLFSLAKDKYNTGRDPYCFALIWVDCLADGPNPVTREKVGVSKAHQKITIDMVGNEQLWYKIDKSSSAAPWNLVTAFIYKDKAGGELIFPIPDADITPDYRKITIDTKNFPDGVTGTVKTKLNVASGFSGGWSFNKNIVVIATRGREDKKYPDSKKKAIVIHEVGHKLGMVPNGSTSLEKQSTLDETYDTAVDKWHCNDRGCTMWWTTEYEKGTFCSACGTNVRRLELECGRLTEFRRFF